MTLAAEAACHLECGRDAVRRHEPELPCGRRVAAAGDENGAQPVEHGTAGVPVGERKARMAGPADAVGLDRTRIGSGVTLRIGQRSRLAS